MPLAARLRPAETVQDLADAQEERYWEGLELMTRGHAGAGIYLMGYSAEMVLKYAYFLVRRYSLLDVVPGLLGTAHRRAQTLNVAESHEGYHNPVFWCELLCAERRQASKPFSPGFEAGVRAAVGVVRDNWKVEMRYQRDIAQQGEAEEFREAVDWLRRNVEGLWRL